MKTFFAMMMLLASLTFISCDGAIDVQQEYAFELETMPVKESIQQGETAEIRCELIKEGDYSQNTYTIRYFQPDGEGELKLDDGTVLLPNDRYPLDRGIFRLYYTSHCDEQQSIDIYIEDSFGQIEELSLSFQDAG